MAESSLAADLLADFNDSDEEEGLEENGTPDISNGLVDQPNGARSRSHGDDGMDIDGEDDDDDDGDVDMTGGKSRIVTDVGASADLSIDDDEETRKAKVAGMHLGAIDDVQSVAGLMKVLEPVLEVLTPRVPDLLVRVTDFAG